MRYTVLLLSAAVAAGAAGVEARMEVTALDHGRRTIYHSAQTPGYTCWAGIWRLPGGEVRVCFTEATGSLSGWRPRAPAAVLRRMPEATRNRAGYDMTGLLLQNTCLRSTDGGRTWQPAGADAFSSCMNGMWGGGIVALADGTVLRDVWGQGLPYWDVPQSGLLQRSVDGGVTWTAPEPLSADPHLQTWPKRLRPLRDGRLLLTGAACPFVPDVWCWDTQLPHLRPCLWVSQDASARAWSAPVYLAPADVRYAGEEWDAAELPNGDLLAVLRTATYDPAGKCLSQERRQCLLTRHGATWEPGDITEAPFAHSGHPELLVSREGPILHIASNGIWWTADRGAGWTRLDVPGTAYYPCATQLEDGTILVVSHVGSDDPYGQGDQSIVLDSFRLSVSAGGRG